MYTIREVCSGALKLVRSMLNRKRKYQIQFNKEKNGCWYVDCNTSCNTFRLYDVVRPTMMPYAFSAVSIPLLASLSAG